MWQAAPAKFKYCSKMTPGTYYKQSGRNTTWSNGVDIPALSLSLSSQSGYSSSTKIAYTFTANGLLCGVDSTWPNARLIGEWDV